MKVINVKFVRLRDVTLDRLPQSVGIYVLWSGKSVVRPAYMGEGIVLKRLANHSDILSQPLEGVIAILGDDSPKTKRDAEMVEAVLLWIAREVDRLPTKNYNEGKWSRVKKVFRGHGTLRINITGFDPLLDPRKPAMNKKKTISLSLDSDGDTVIDHPWKTRSI